MTSPSHPHVRTAHAAIPVIPAEIARHQPGHGWQIASAIAVAILLGFLLVAYVALPDELPVWQQRLLALLNAVLMLLAFALVTHRSPHHPNLNALVLRHRKGQHSDFGRQLRERPKPSPRTINLPILGATSTRGVTGAGVFVGAILWWLTPWAPITVQTQETENLAVPLGKEIETVVLTLADNQLAVAHPPARPALAAALASTIPIDSGPYLLGQRSTAQGAYDEARDLLNSALSTEAVKPAEVYLALGQNELFAGKYLEAANQYDHVLQTQPTDPHLWCQAAVAWLHAGNYARAEELIQKGMELADGLRHDPKDPSARAIEAICRHVQAAVLICRGKESEEAEEHNKQVQDIWKDMLGESNAYAASLNNQAVLFQLLGKYAAAQNNYNFAYGTWTKGLGSRHPYMAVSRGNLAMLYYVQGRYSDARRLAEQVARLRGETLASQHPAQALSQNLSALLDLANGDYRTGLGRARRAMEILEEQFPPRHPQMAAVARCIGGLYQGLAQDRRAEYYYFQMAEISRNSLGNFHPYLASSLYWLATLYLEEGRDGEARSRADYALKVDEKAFGEDHPAVARDLCLLARIASHSGQADAARPMLERAATIQESVLSEQHPDLAQTKAAIAALKNLPADYADGVALYQKAIETARGLLGEQHPMVAQFHSGLARLHLSQGNLAAAEEEVRSCLEIRRASLVAYHPQLADALELQAEVLRKTEPGAKEQIESLVREAAQIRSDHADKNASDSQYLGRIGH
jgi:tetratricopeptide (TPR) repeat protein